MPFTPPPEVPNSSGKDEEKLFRVASLWPSKAGNALMGNAFVAGGRRPDDPEGPQMGEQLIELIQQCMESGRKLRVLVFENVGKYGRKSSAPYTIYVRTGDIQEAQPGVPEVYREAGAAPTARPPRGQAKPQYPSQGPDIGTLPGEVDPAEWGAGPEDPDAEAAPPVPVTYARPPVHEMAPPPHPEPTPRPPRRAAPRR